MSGKEPKRCAFCGKEFRGWAWTVKGSKKICGECREMLHKDMPGDEWRGMTVKQLKEHFADKELMDTQKTCSFCGEKMSANDTGKMVLSDKSVLCGKCVGSMRIAKPVFVTVARGSGYDYKEVADDPLPELTIEDVPWVQKEAAEERERRAAKYGKHKAVFVVDDVTRYKKADDAHQVYGRVVLGRIDKGDTLRIRRKEGEYRKVVTWIDPLEYNKKAGCLSEGHEGNLMILGDVSFIYPGDVLTVEKI